MFRKDFAIMGALIAGGLGIAILGTGIQVAHADSVIATIRVGPPGSNTFPSQIAFDAANRNLYVTNEGMGYVSVISGQTNTVIGTPIKVGSGAAGIAFDYNNGGLYVANSFDLSPAGTVSVISGQTNTVVGTPIPVGYGPIGIAFDPIVLGHVNPFGSLFVTNVEDDNVSIISGRTNRVESAPIPVGHFPSGIAYDSANGNMYLANGGDATISVISSQNYKVIDTIPGAGDGTRIGGIAFDSANGDLYVTNFNTDTVSVISGQTNSVIGSPIHVGDGPGSIAFDSANGNLYVTNFFDNTVSVISGQTNSVIGSPIPVGLRPEGIAFDSANGDLYVANNIDNTVSVIAPRHTTSLTLAVASKIPWGTKATISGKLTDVDTAAGIGVASKTIKFTTSNGSPLPASVTTASDGSYKAKLTASNTIFSGWNIQAHFAGDSLYKKASSSVHTYNTTKHTTTLTLVISPTSVAAGGTYSVSGGLRDHSAGTIPLASKTITFTTTSPITINSATTTSTGQYFVSGLTAPTTAGTYSIRSHFAGDTLYNAANSQTQTLTVSTIAAPTATGPRPK